MTRREYMKNKKVIAVLLTLGLAASAASIPGYGNSAQAATKKVVLNKKKITVNVKKKVTVKVKNSGKKYNGLIN